MSNGPIPILSDIQTKMLRLSPFVNPDGEGRELYNELEKDMYALRTAIERQGAVIKAKLSNKITEFLEE